MIEIDACVIAFQCREYGHDLAQSIGRLKSEAHMPCPGCGIGINIDTTKLSNTADKFETLPTKFRRDQIEFF